MVKRFNSKQGAWVVIFSCVLLLATVYGDKTLTYFSLEHAGGDDSDDSAELFNPKQKVYAECVKDAVESVLVSNEIATELTDCNIQIVEVRSYMPASNQLELILELPFDSKGYSLRNSMLYNLVFVSSKSYCFIYSRIISQIFLLFFQNKIHVF